MSLRTDSLKRSIGQVTLAETLTGTFSPDTPLVARALATNLMLTFIQDMKPSEYMRLRQSIGLRALRDSAVRYLTDTIHNLPPEMQKLGQLVQEINSIKPPNNGRPASEFVADFENILVRFFPEPTAQSVEDLLADPALLACHVAFESTSKFTHNLHTYGNVRGEHLANRFSLSRPLQSTHVSKIEQFNRIYDFFIFFDSSKYYIDRDTMHAILFDPYFADTPQSLRQDFEETIALEQQPNEERLSMILEQHGIDVHSRLLSTKNVADYLHIEGQQTKIDPTHENQRWIEKYKKLCGAIQAKGSVEYTQTLADGSTAYKVVATSLAGNFITLAIQFPDGMHALLHFDTLENLYGLNKNAPGTSDEDIKKVQQLAYAALAAMEKQLFTPPPMPARRDPTPPPHAHSTQHTQARREHAYPQVPARHDSKLLAHLEAMDQRARAKAAAAAANRKRSAPPPSQGETGQNSAEASISVEQRIKGLVGEDMLEELLGEFPHQQNVLYGIFDRYFRGLGEHVKFKEENLKGYDKYSILYHGASYRVITGQISLDGRLVVVPIDVYKKRNEDDKEHKVRASRWGNRLRRIETYRKTHEESN